MEATDDGPKGRELSEFAREVRKNNPELERVRFQVKGLQKGRIRKIVDVEGKPSWAADVHYDVRGCKLFVTPKRGVRLERFELHGNEYDPFDASPKRKSYYWKLSSEAMQRVLEGLDREEWIVRRRAK